SLQARFGGTILNEFAESENFGDKQRQNQIQLFSSLTFYPMSNLGITTNLREIIFNDTEVFVPSLGAEYILSERINRSILLRGQVSRDFRVPTFNDLFWIPGGNLELRPERSSNAEVGLDFGLEKTTIRFTSFYSDINDWIQWRPINSVWSPRNLRRVKTRGLESFIDTQVPVGQSLLSIAVAYTYVRSEDQSIDERNQLPYVPEHEFFGSLNTILGDYVLGFRGNFTSVRYTTLTNSIQSQVDEFLLFDASIRRSLTLKGVAVECRLNLTNLFDANYQVVKNHAMPGRAFSIELTTKF
ncbi:MAG: TonB-dependent receptor, partial [Bacteroidota bacterium]